MLDFAEPGIESFRRHLAEQIPCLPATVVSKQFLFGLSFPDVLRVYLNWKDRFIADRKRRLLFRPTFDLIAANGDAGFAEICRCCENGDSLYSFMSKRIDTDGFSIVSSSRRTGPGWKDKDYVLACFDVHHLHTRPFPSGKPKGKGTSELYYIRFTRDEAHFILRGNHRSFDDQTLAEAVMRCRAEDGSKLMGICSPHHGGDFTLSEKNNLQRKGFATTYNLGESVVPGAMIAGDGTNVRINFFISRFLSTLSGTRQSLASQDVLQSLFSNFGIQGPKDPRFVLHNCHCDFGVMELNTRAFFNFWPWHR